MIDLSFAVTDAGPALHAAAPTLTFRLRIVASSGAPVHAILLRSQVQIDPRRRQHEPSEKDRLNDIFGEPARWGETLGPLLWTQASLVVPAFAGNIEIDLPIACTYDFEVTWAKYLHALRGGDVPLRFFFSGSVFAKTGSGFSVEPVPWNKEASFRLPVKVWRDLMDAYYPGSAWIRLQRESLEALHRFRARNLLMSWDDTINALLAATEAPAR